MNERSIRTLLEAVRAGQLTPDAAVARLRHLPFTDLEYSKVDHHRSLRCGFPEVIFCPGKTPAAVGRIAREVLRHGGDLLATRADRRQVAAIRQVAPRAVHHPAARAVTVRAQPAPAPDGLVLIVAAGTSDMPVAEEARVTAEIMGARVESLYDVGVAGLHRLLQHVERLQQAQALVVVAGMEGALASVVGGLVRRPVIAVPTSVGYGASFGGVAALLAMLNSCAAGVSVVNIDNGFGGGFAAALINRGTAAATGTPSSGAGARTGTSARLKGRARRR